jgi:hypothetical protein
MGTVKKVLLVLVAAGLAAASPATAGAHAVGWSRFAVSSSKGAHATVGVSGNVKGPRYLALRATAYPAQKMTVRWSVRCGTTTSTGLKTGQFVSYGHGHNIVIAQPFAHPSWCSVAAATELSKSGTIYLSLWVYR